MFNYEIGGNERHVDASEAITDIAHNKTLLIQKLTEHEPIKPVKAEGLKTVEDVFTHYKPNINIEFENIDGNVVDENINFNNLGDFGLKQIIQRSSYLTDLNIQKELSLNIIKQLKTNKTLKTALENTETKASFINALKCFVNELNQK